MASISAALIAGGADGFGLSWAKAETAVQQRASRNRTAMVERFFIIFLL
jgi:hypothetical protein